MAEIGIGPAIRVLRHLTDRQRLYQLKFASGERALVLIAGMPVPSVQLVRVVLGGFVPWQTVWEYNPVKAGGYSDYVHKLRTMFSPKTEGMDDSLRCIRDSLGQCQSILEARMMLIERERVANSSETDAVEFPPRAPDFDATWELGIRAFPRKSSPQTARMLVIPDRYRTKTERGRRSLTCIEAPMVTVQAQRGAAISSKRARNYPAGAIFLGGAAQGEPFVDARKDLYNLSHPQGCIRSLASCEQAMVLIRKVLDLRKRDWVVLANDSTLDTILALWVLLNHLRLDENARIRAKIMPLLRLEGVTDAHGLEMQDLAALPPDVLRSTSAMLKALGRQKTIPTSAGASSENEFLEYVADALRAVDELIYSPTDFEERHNIIGELAQANVVNGSVVVACRSDADTAEIERQLQRIYGQRLGVMIVESAASTYRLRRIDQTLPATLEPAFDRLNLLDPAVNGGSQNRWSGSAEIGGSPRGVQTRLTPSQILRAVREVFQKPTIVDVMSELPGAGILTIIGLFPASVSVFAGKLLRDHGYPSETAFLPAVVFAITAAVLFWLKSRRVPGLYGWRVPTGIDCLAVIPVAVVAAVMGGVWAPGPLGYGTIPRNENEFTLAAILSLSLGAELLFRGVILGHLAFRLPLRTSAGRRWSSWPTVISSALYGAVSLLLLQNFSTGEFQSTQCLVTITAAFVFGIASGIARERSESIVPSVLLHWGCAAALLLADGLVS